MGTRRNKSYNSRGAKRTIEKKKKKGEKKVPPTASIRRQARRNADAGTGIYLGKQQKMKKSIPQGGGQKRQGEGKLQSRFPEERRRSFSRMLRPGE